MVLTLNVEFTGVNLLQILQPEKLASSWSGTSSQPYRITPGRTTHSEFVYASWKHKPKTSLLFSYFLRSSPEAICTTWTGDNSVGTKTTLCCCSRKKIGCWRKVMHVCNRKCILCSTPPKKQQQKQTNYNKILEFRQLPINRWWMKCCVNVYISGNRKSVFTNECSVTCC